MRARDRRPPACLVIVLLAACLQPLTPPDNAARRPDARVPCPADTPALSLPAAQRDSLPPLGGPEPYPTPDEEWAIWAREVPGGFAGLTSDVDEVRNRIVYGVLDEAARRRAEGRLQALGVPCFLVLVVVEIAPPAQPL